MKTGCSPSAKLKAAERVTLGDSDLSISACTLGTMTWGEQNTEAEGHEQLNWAFDHGINILDSAEMYPIPTKADTQGRTDRIIASWMKGRKRDDIVLASKVSGFSERTTWVRDPPKTVRVNREQIVESVERSLQRLGTDHIDLLQIHWPDRYVPLFGATSYDVKLERKDSVPFEEQLMGLEEVVRSGKSHEGLCRGGGGVTREPFRSGHRFRVIAHSSRDLLVSYGVSEFVRASKATGLPKIVSIQNSYSLIVRGAYETDLAETCSQHNVGLLAYSPLAGGSLTGKYNHGVDHPKARLNLFAGYMARYKLSLVREAVSAYEEVAAKYEMTPTQLALAWCKSRWFVTSTIIGATSLAQLKQNVEAFDTNLSQAAIDDVNTVFKRYRDPSIQ
ncbi:MAG: hypothetical protein WDW38_005157 [Sanguina aurantia]